VIRFFFLLWHFDKDVCEQRFFEKIHRENKSWQYYRRKRLLINGQLGHLSVGVEGEC
jgi:hypothetical protein